MRKKFNIFDKNDFFMCIYKCMYLIEKNDNLNKNNVENYSTGYNQPIVEFESYIPNDFVYAPAPGMSFKYSIKSPSGHNIFDDTKGLEIDDYLAYSVVGEDGKYYWTYNVHYSDFGTPNPGYEDYQGSWIPAYSQFYYPQTYIEPMVFDLKSAQRGLETQTIIMDVYFRSNYPPLNIYPSPVGSDNYLIDNNYPYFINLLSSSVLDVNDWMLGNYHWEADWLGTMFYKLVIEEETKSIVMKPIDFFYGDNIIHIRVPKEEHGGEKFKLTLETNYEFQYQNTTDGEMLVTPEHVNYDLIVPLGEYSYYSMNFDDDNLVSEVKIPYAYNDSGLKNEVYTFEKMFPNSYDYPTTTKDLLQISYSDGYSDELPLIDIPDTATLKINGYPETEINIIERIKDNKLIISVEESMFYDYEKEEVVFGLSSGKFENEVGIVIPWDEKVSGTIEFDIVSNTKVPRTFNFKLEIGSNNILRGPGGKYEIKEVKDGEFN